MFNRGVIEKTHEQEKCLGCTPSLTSLFLLECVFTTSVRFAPVSYLTKAWTRPGLCPDIKKKRAKGQYKQQTAVYLTFILQQAQCYVSLRL